MIKKPLTDWKNKSGTSKRKECSCGSWKQHWINNTEATWPEKCSVSGCNNKADQGLHVINQYVEGEQIIPGCQGCNNKTEGRFELKPGTDFVSANKTLTCEILNLNLI